MNEAVEQLYASVASNKAATGGVLSYARMIEDVELLVVAALNGDDGVASTSMRALNHCIELLQRCAAMLHFDTFALEAQCSDELRRSRVRMLALVERLKGWRAKHYY